MPHTRQESAHSMGGLLQEETTVYLISCEKLKTLKNHLWGFNPFPFGGLLAHPPATSLIFPLSDFSVAEESFLHRLYVDCPFEERLG